MKPSPDGLADNKKTQRNVDIMMGLFGPARYNISKYPEHGTSYDISRMGDSYRELSVLLNRSGGGLHSVDLYFDGAVDFFKELPSPDQISMTDYHKISNRTVKP